MALSSSAPAPRRPFEHWMLLGGALASALAVVAIGAWITPDPRGYGTHEQLGLAPCHFLAWTGIPCPGCGVTTSVALAMHGRFAASFANQPFGLAVALAVPAAAVVALVQHARGRDLGALLASLRPLWILLAVGVACAAGWAWKYAAMRPG